uniref:SoxC n=1 Tax=Sycon ciliatum TaxID=27933 RepID=I7DEE7_9METZ|nr:SoxC [Sycon ciliatum]|eukprot:scpid7166/ scgid3087/ Protein SOX-15; Protein SOX-12; Protein SOX-20
MMSDGSDSLSFSCLCILESYARKRKRTDTESSTSSSPYGSSSSGRSSYGSRSSGSSSSSSSSSSGSSSSDSSDTESSDSESDIPRPSQLESDTAASQLPLSDYHLRLRARSRRSSQDNSSNVIVSNSNSSVKSSGQSSDSNSSIKTSGQSSDGNSSVKSSGQSSDSSVTTGDLSSESSTSSGTESDDSYPRPGTVVKKKTRNSRLAAPAASTQSTTNFTPMSRIMKSSTCISVQQAKQQQQHQLQQLHAPGERRRKIKGAAAEHVKRPKNAFMVWSSLERKERMAKNPKLHNAEISKDLGRVWKSKTEDEKKPFYDMAKREKIEHQAKYPDYKYRPKKKPVKLEPMVELVSKKPVAHSRSRDTARRSGSKKPAGRARPNVHQEPLIPDLKRRCILQPSLPQRNAAAATVCSQSARSASSKPPGKTSSSVSSYTVQQPQALPGDDLDIARDFNTPESLPSDSETTSLTSDDTALLREKLAQHIADNGQDGNETVDKHQQNCTAALTPNDDLQKPLSEDLHCAHPPYVAENTETPPLSPSTAVSAEEYSCDSNRPLQFRSPVYYESRHTSSMWAPIRDLVPGAEELIHLAEMAETGVFPVSFE